VDLGGIGRGLVDDLEDAGRPAPDERAHPRVGLEDPRRIPGPPHRGEPRPVGHRHRLVVPGDGLVDDPAQQGRLRAERRGDGGPRHAGRDRDLA
jgi:hypothetical protein